MTSRVCGQVLSHVAMCCDCVTEAHYPVLLCGGLCPLLVGGGLIHMVAILSLLTGGYMSYYEML